VLKGGGLSAGREGSFTFDIAVALTGAEVPVTSLTVRGQFIAAMDTPRTFSRLATKAEAAATGPQFPRGVKLRTDLSAARAAAGESYTVALSDEAHLLASLTADLPAAAKNLGGAWKLDVRDTDLAPFTLGRPLPKFTLVGSGGLDVEVASSDVRLTGKLDAAVDKLGVVQPQLAALGAVQLTTEFDVARRGDSVAVERLTAAFSATEPVAQVQSLQPFAFNARTGELKVADPARELLGLSLQNLPLAWLQPFAPDYAISGGGVRGEFVATARNGGFALRAKAPLSLAGVTVAKAGRPLVRAVDVVLTPAADYAPQGWQAEITGLTLSSGGAPVLSLDARAGRLAGRSQPIKATGKLSAHLPALLAQPIATGVLVLTAGDASADFVASFGEKQELQAKVALTGLATDPKLSAEKLPSLSADLRADIAAKGTVTLTVPLVIERDGRKSDLTLSGTLTPALASVVIDAHVTGANVVVEDVQVLATPLAPSVPTDPSAKPASAPPWAGLSGQVAVALKKVIYTDLVQLSEVTGTVRLESGAARLVNFRAGVGPGAEAKISGDLTFDAQVPAPYGLTAEVAVSDFDPAPFFHSANPTQPATVEGKFSLVSKLGGRATALTDFATTAHGDIQLTSKAGAFRGLPVSFATKAESTGKIAASVAAVSNLFGSVTGKKEYADLANKAQAVTELTKSLNPIPYDQLNVVLTRDAAQNTVLKDFTLISPELRLSGSGQATCQSGQSLLDGSLTMEFKLRARGRQSEVLKFLGALDPQVDDLGYAACTLPLKIAGTIGHPDTSELNRSLANLALEKAGVTEKATELFNKLIGGGK
jgi:hypothetical protein